MPPDHAAAGGAAPLPVAAPSIFDELKQYVGFDRRDEEALRDLHPHLAPSFARIADVFYQRILAHEGSRRALQGGESQVGHLKVKLVEWMDKLFSGPWDHDYYELRSRIGRKHVRISLPQHYMFGAMNVLRRELTIVIDEVLIDDRHRFTPARVALGRILDLELAIMLHTYREDLLAAHAKAERLATFGQLVGSIGHELRNPLAVIETSLHILKGRVEGDERALKHTARIGNELLVANGIITGLLDMIRDRPLTRAPVRLAEVVAGALPPQSPGVRLSVEGVDGLPPIEGDAAQLRQVLVNLITNAVQAVGASGRVSVTGALEGRTAAVAIEDSGPGVDEEMRRRLFEPLVTTRPKGVGLGLALCRRIAERHGGSISYEPRGAGARFVVRLPVAG